MTQCKGLKKQLDEDGDVSVEIAGREIVVSPKIVCFVSKEDRCRGPICAAVFKSMLRDESVKAISCGLDADDGGQIDALTADILAEAGYIKQEKRGTLRSSKVDYSILRFCVSVIADDDDTAMRLIIDCPDLASKIRCLQGPIEPAASICEEEYRRVLGDAEDRIGKMTGKLE